jgi:hypothetical protein
MKRFSGPHRTAFNLSNSLHRRLNAYALAASAAGAGVLTLTQRAEAKIVYTPDHAQMSHVGTFPFALDLNHDGIADFTFPTSSFVNSGFFQSAMAVSPVAKNNRAWGVQYASALKAGVRVGVNGKFGNPGNLLMGLSSGTSGGFKGFRGPWENGGKGVKNRYLGLKFVIKGKVHFGWARINFANPSNVILTGYAYETIPNKPIITGATKGTREERIEQPNDPGPNASWTHATADVPHTATLGALAMGAPGLAIWRQEDSTSATPERH